jgi:DNA-binding XRE family transcriptional regulator
MPAGHVYFATAENGLTKIGASIKPVSRVSGLAMGSPVGMSLVHVIETDDMAWLEWRMHTRFKGKRVRGEWFALTEGDLAEVRAARRASRPARSPRIHIPTRSSQTAQALREAFGPRLRHLRDGRGWSLGQLSLRSGVSRSFLCELERGRRLPSLEVAIALADALGLATIDELVGREARP